MTTPIPLPELGYELQSIDPAYDNFRFGEGTNYRIATVDFGSIESETGDIPQPRADGVRFGRDYYRGRLIAFEGNIWTARSNPGSAVAAPNLLRELTGAWTPDLLRSTPGRVTALRMQRSGRTIRVYGRPNRVSSTAGATKRGRIPFSMDFRCVDHYFYDDVEFTEVIPFIPPAVGGLIGELIGDIYASSAGVSDATITVNGNKPSWLVWKVHGPIQNPEIEVVDRWKAKLNLTLAADQFVIVDPTPWNRSVRRNTGANAAGAFTAQSQRLSAMLLPPGPSQVLLRGTDNTGTSSLQLYWRDTYSMA